MSRRVWLVYGPPEEEEFLITGAGEEVRWTIHRDAVVGDDVLFYLRAPVSAIMAIGTILTKPKKSPWAEKWSKVMPYGAQMRVTKPCAPRIEFRQMADDEELSKAWGLVRAQMQSTNGPQIVLPSILTLLRDNHGLEMDS